MKDVESQTAVVEGNENDERSAVHTRKMFNHFRRHYPDSILIFQFEEEYRAFMKMHGSAQRFWGLTWTVWKKLMGG